jgi:hypothetical protein
MGPMCPVVQEATPCPDQPLKVKLVVESPSGKDIAEGTSDAGGAFRIPLEAGEYILVPEDASAAGVTSVSTQSFSVEEGTWVTVDVHYDTGMR